MNLKIILIFTLIIIDASIVKNFEFPSCGSTRIPCICHDKAKETFVSLKYRMTAVKDPVTGEVQCVERQKPSDVCDRMSCDLNTNEFDLDEIESFLTRGTRSLRIPPRGNSDLRRRRSKPAKCEIEEMKHATVSCQEYDKAIICKLTCDYGYAFKSYSGGSEKSTVIHCLNHENVWKPHGFTGCKPYFNCNMVLVDAGKLECSAPTITGPVCMISCWDWEGNMSTGLSKHECISGTIVPPLPRCATVKRVRLIKPPIETADETILGTTTEEDLGPYIGYLADSP